MLRNIPDIISPELMNVMMQMGHGDELCFCDANFPAESMGAYVVRADGHSITALLDSVLEFFPLDSFVEHPAILMAAPAGSEPSVWRQYEDLLKRHDFAGGFTHGFEKLERFDFYDRAMDCFAVIATSEHEAYSNLILKKGVIL